MGRIATVGMFDGVHSGHRYVLERLARYAQQEGLEPLALTFGTHPRLLLGHTPPPLLTDTSLRLDLLRSCGVEAATLDLTADDMRQTAGQFLRRLRDSYGVEVLAMGYDNRIGSDRRALDTLGRDCEGVKIIAAFDKDDSLPPASSTAVRHAVSVGDIDRANAMLGHAFSVRGRVVHGRGVGHTIGFPTANIEPCEPLQLLPADGVYAVALVLPLLRLPAVANVGTRPTFGTDLSRTLEVYVPGYDGNLYDQLVDVEFRRHIRAERRFENIDELRRQIDADSREALKP